MKKSLAITKTIKALIVLLALTPAIFPFPLVARDLGDVEKDIEQKEQELKTINSQLSSLQKGINNNKETLKNVEGEIPKLKLQIAQAEQELEYNQLELENLNVNRELKDLEYEQAKSRQEQLVKLSYLNWKTGLTDSGNVLASMDIKNNVYQSVVISDGHGSLEELIAYIDSLNSQIESYQADSANLLKQKEELKTRKLELEQEQSKILADLEAKSKQVSGAKQRQGSVASQLDQYYEEQKSILAYEAELQKQKENGSATGNVNDPTGNEQENNDDDQPTLAGLYIGGQGRDLYQGHGVGMSQFGALGAALQGWDYKKILQFYYKGAEVKKYQTGYQIKVSGFGQMHIDKYVAGAAEVPVTACEDIGIPFDTKNIWRCWPREAIKAQAVAYRTYAMNYTQNGATICTTTSCQVYNGSQNMKWAADATAGEVLIYSGAPIKALYSSDNNQGAGTANNDTVWSDYSGKGWPVPYLRSVNDNAFTYRTSYSTYKWRTNSYTIAKLREMLQYVNKDSGLSGARSHINGILSSIGELKSMELVKDPSGRVARVKIIGTNGSGYVAGWLFKSIWNAWVYNVKPSGEVDYIYSLTFSINRT